MPGEPRGGGQEGPQGCPRRTPNRTLSASFYVGLTCPLWGPEAPDGPGRRQERQNAQKGHRAPQRDPQIDSKIIQKAGFKYVCEEGIPSFVFGLPCFNLY